MNKVKLFLFCILFSVGVSNVNAQKYVYKGYQILFRYAESGKWTDWSGWHDADDSIVIDFENDNQNIIIDTAVFGDEEESRIYLILYEDNIKKFSPTSGVKDYQYSVFWLHHLVYGTAKIHYYEKGTLQLHIYLPITDEDKIEIFWLLK